MPLTEKDVGITEMLGSHRPFRAVLKQMAHDFIVNEVLLSGEVCTLTKFPQAAPPRQQSGKRRSRVEEEPQPDVPLENVRFEELEKIFGDDYTGKIASNVEEFMKQGGEKLPLPVCNDRAVRTEAHAWIKRNLTGYHADTEERKTSESENSRVIVLKKNRKNGRSAKRRRFNDSTRNTNEPKKPSFALCDTDMKAVDKREGNEGINQGQPLVTNTSTKNVQTHPDKHSVSQKCVTNSEKNEQMSVEGSPKNRIHDATVTKDEHTLTTPIAQMVDAPPVEEQQSSLQEKPSESFEQIREEKKVEGVDHQSALENNNERHTQINDTPAASRANPTDLNQPPVESHVEAPRASVGRNTTVSFVLWKCNKDTHDAINALSKALRIPSKQFSYAGTKDKRAITTQQVRVRGVHEARLARANGFLWGRNRKYRSIALGNFKVEKGKEARPLRLGDLLGNRFTLVLRDLELADETGEDNLKRAVESVNTYGFINYFGLQRFGTGLSGTHETGFALLRGHYEDVCRRLLLPVSVVDSSDDKDARITPKRKAMIEAQNKFGKKEISAAQLVDALPHWMRVERTIASSFAEDERKGAETHDYKGAFERLPLNLRRMYGHAVQSYMWNVMASARIRRLPPNDPGRMHAVKGDLIMDCESDEEVNFRTPVSVVTEAQEENKSISVFRVLIPVIGSEVSVPEEAPYYEAAQEILKAQRMDITGNMARELGLKGTYRRLIGMAKDVEVKVVPYTDNKEMLVHDARLPDDKNNIATDVNQCDSIKPSSKLRTWSQQELPPCCKTGAKPQNDLEISTDVGPGNVLANGKKTTDAHEETIETSQQNGAQNFDSSPVAIPSKEPTLSHPEGGVSVEKSMKSTIEARKALITSFTLRRGEFATMLIRELTGQDSSKANHKAMQTSANMGNPEAGTEDIQAPKELASTTM